MDTKEDKLFDLKMATIIMLSSQVGLWFHQHSILVWISILCAFGALVAMVVRGVFLHPPTHYADGMPVKKGGQKIKSEDPESWTLLSYMVLVLFMIVSIFIFQIKH